MVIKLPGQPNREKKGKFLIEDLEIIAEALRDFRHRVVEDTRRATSSVEVEDLGTLKQKVDLALAKTDQKISRILWGKH